MGLCVMISGFGISAPSIASPSTVRHKLVSAMDAGRQELPFIIERWEVEPREDRVMARSTSVAAVLSPWASGLPAYGQETGGNRSGAAGAVRQCPGQFLNKDHLAPTGATLPHPGVPQAEGTTEPDRSVQRQDDRTDESICKGC